MAKPYTINIINGSGSERVLNGDYTVTTNAVGYDNMTIDPASISVVAGTNNYNFTVSATGTLTFHVSEDGTSTGTPIVGATFKRCDAEGNEYGSEVVSDANGNVEFNHIPFAATGAPTVYYKQINSDLEHEFDNTLKNTTLEIDTKIIEVMNTIPEIRTISYTDEFYENLPIEMASIILN